MLLCTDPEMIVLLSLAVMLLVVCLLVRWCHPGRHGKQRSAGEGDIQR